MPGGAFGDDDRAEHVGLSGDVVEDADNEVAVIADRDGWELADAVDAEAERCSGSEDCDSFVADRMAFVGDTSGAKVGTNGNVQAWGCGLDRQAEHGLPGWVSDW